MITVTDLFCGAGGSGLGATAVPGVELSMAANHSPRAIETHTANFPDVDHDCADISQVEPRRYARSNILWASPECTNHSIARGRRREQQQGLFGDPVPNHVVERSRATMWDVPRFAEVHRYDAIVVENVVDAANWVPFTAWLMAMDSYGYDHHIVSLNSMHAPAIAAPRAPQSRDRMYVVFWRKGNRAPNLDIRPAAWCSSCDVEVRAMQSWKNGKKIGRYRSQYVYRCPNVACRNAIVEPYALPAASAIDWTLPGQRIGDRPKPLSDKTRARIAAGLERYANQSLVLPVEGRGGKHAAPTSAPMRTQTARHESALLVPAGGTWNEAATPASDPFRARTTREAEGIAFIAELRGGSSDARPVTDPLATVCASGNHHMLVRHNTARGNPGQMCTSATEPARTLTTAGHQSLVGWPTTTPTVDDCSFRMLAVPEIQAAMAFAPDYQVTGTKRERVQQLGNGVTPPAAEWLIRSVVASLDHDTATHLAA